MSWQILITVSVLLYTAAALLHRKLVAESDSRPIAYAIVFEVLVGVMIGAFGLLKGDWQWPVWQPLLVRLAVMTILYALGNICIFTSLKTVEASKFTVLFATRGLFTIFASSLLLSEGLSPTQLLGALGIFAGVMIVNWRAKQLELTKGDWLALGAGLCFGLANTNDRALLMQMNVYTFVSVGFLLPAILLSVVYPKEAIATKLFFQPDLFKRMLLLCLVYAGSSLTFFMALQTTTNSSQVAAINLSSVILIVLAAAVLLKERNDLAKKIVGAILSFIGLVLVSR